MTTLLPDPVRQLIGPDATSHLRDLGFDVTSATPEYVRYKPDAGAVVSFLFHRDDDEHRGYVRWCSSSQRANEVVRKATTMRVSDTVLGRGVKPLADGHTVLFLFPNDARMRRLRWGASIRKLKRSLEDTHPLARDVRTSRSELRVVRYKPERRLIARADLALRNHDDSVAVFVRFASEPVARNLHIAADLAAKAGVAVATPVAQLEGGRLHIECAVPGEDLVAAVAGARFDRADEVFDTLARIHAVGPPDVLPRRPPPYPGLWAALCSVRTYDQKLTDIASRIASAARRLDPPPVNAFVHGDMHLHQLLAGRRTYVVDWERAAIGSPMVDIGRWYAHGVALARRLPTVDGSRVGAFCMDVLDRALAHPSFEPVSFALHASAGLVDQALRGARHLEDDWQEHAHVLLECALGWVEDPRRALDSADLVAVR